MPTNARHDAHTYMYIPAVVRIVGTLAAQNVRLLPIVAVQYVGEPERLQTPTQHVRGLTPKSRRPGAAAAEAPERR